MEHIIIEVSEETASEWNKFSLEIKKKLERNFGKQIEFLSRGVKDDKFFALLDKISDEAEKNGLTEEILEHLLNED